MARYNGGGGGSSRRYHVSKSGRGKYSGPGGRLEKTGRTSVSVRMEPLERLRERQKAADRSTSETVIDDGVNSGYTRRRGTSASAANGAGISIPAFQPRKRTNSMRHR